MNKFLLNFTAFIATSVLGFAASAQTTSTDSQDQNQLFKATDLNIQAGLRIWGNEWDIPVFSLTPTISNNGTPVLQEKVTTRNSNFKFVPIPVLGLTYGRFAGNMTYMVPTHYDAGVEGLSSVRREEFDASFGYSLLPPAESVLVATVSYKYVNTDSTTTDFQSRTNINAILFGLTGSVPIYDKLRLTGSFSIGPARQRLNTPDGEEKDNALYQVLELGFSYPLISEAHGALHSLSLALTYRAQFYTIKGVQLATRNSVNPSQIISTERRDITSTTLGPVIGLIGSF